MFFYAHFYFPANDTYFEIRILYANAEDVHVKLLLKLTKQRAIFI